MTGKKQSQRSESDELQIRKIELKWSLFGKVVEHGFKWGAFAFGFWCIKEAWILSAGTTTIANLTASFKLETISSWTLPLLAVTTLGSILYGRRQAKLRQDTVEHLHVYQVKYEKSIDPNRTSSRLTSRGETRPEDR